MGDNLAIDVKAVRKTYKGRVHALCGVDMQARQGEIFGLLGPNGAGKSTTMNIISCILAASSGSAKINGFDTFEQSLEIRKIIGEEVYHFSF